MTLTAASAQAKHPTPGGSSGEPNGQGERPSSGTAVRGMAPGTAATPDTSALPQLDVLGLADRLPAEERERLLQIREHLQSVVRPQVIEYWNEEEFAFDLLPGLAELGLGRLQVDGTSRLFKGLVYAEVTRADVSLSALVGIHNELIVGMIHELGSEAQKEQWLPRLERFEAIGAFALTEPEHGSDIAGGLETTAERDGEEWVITGAKRWIGAGTIADVALVWARDTSDGEVKGFLVETDRPGYRATKIRNKTGLRIMQNADIELDAVRIPAENLLPGATDFSQANELLKDSRAWVGWQGAGIQLAAFEIARDYALTRQQFGRPLAKFQLIQDGLAEMLGNASASLAMMGEIARLQERGELEMPQAAMVKATTTRLARSTVAIARNALGGNGICSEFEAAKVFNDAEVLYTYEGTYQINQLIVGRAVTGMGAFI